MPRKPKISPAARFYFHYECDVVREDTGDVMTNTIHDMILRMGPDIIGKENPMVVGLQDHDQIFPSHVTKEIALISWERIPGSELRANPINGEGGFTKPFTRKNAKGGLQGLISP